ncbi:hypothetical protein [Gordonia tangerina]|uniref:Glutaredoxin n=1 Tax=Gordonia tangerina TaxID=2911060 RepID=A0ABS9DDI0_9ACTN|nr:hypothetical protein [Gordonia tangerina]MCF3937183.1 hypothetical protein [Gordonia tangerina]
MSDMTWMSETVAPATARIVVAPKGFCPGCVRTKRRLSDAIAAGRVTVIPGDTDAAAGVIADLDDIDPGARRIAPIVVVYGADGSPLDAWSEMREDRVTALRDALAA